MKKITLILFTIIAAFFFSSCDEKLGDDIKPVTVNLTIIGKWSFKSLGTITNLKTYDATIDDIKAFSGNNTTGVDSLSKLYSYEFKTDSSYIAGADSGKWKFSSDHKTLVLTSKVTKDFNGNFQVQSLELINLSLNELKLGFKKFTADANGEINTSTFEDFLYFALANFAIQIKGTQEEANAATSIQATITLKR